MSKKVIISLSVVLCVIAVMLILFWTLFGLSSVTVEFSSTTQNLSVSAEEIVKAGQFRYGACVLFEGKKKSIEKINAYAEQNENFAYIRVVNIETVFPNKFVIHVAEREELFAVEVLDGADKQYLVCDRDFRVLRTADEFDSTQSDAILLKGLNFKNEQFAIGDFLDVEQSAMLKFHSSMLQNNRSLSEQLGKFETLELGVNVDEFSGQEFVSLTLTTFQGRKFVINNIDFAFANKMALMFATESALFSQPTDEAGNILNKNGEKIYAVKNASGEFVTIMQDANGESVEVTEETEGAVTLSYSLLENCIIKIDNLTLDENVKRTEKDIYYSLCEVVE